MRPKSAPTAKVGMKIPAGSLIPKLQGNQQSFIEYVRSSTYVTTVIKALPMRARASVLSNGPL